MSPSSVITVQELIISNPPAKHRSRWHVGQQRRQMHLMWPEPPPTQPSKHVLGVESSGARAAGSQGVEFNSTDDVMLMKRCVSKTRTSEAPVCVTKATMSTAMA